MAELLIIIGVSGIIISTLGLMHEASQRNHSAVFFLVPLASLGQVQKNWEDYRWWALARVASVLTAAVGIALWAMMNQAFEQHPIGSQSGQTTGQVLRGNQMASSTAFVSSEEAALLVVKGQGKPLSGRLHGEPFRYDRVALIDGVLTLSQGEDFLSDLEVRILLGWQPEEITERRTLLVGPADQDAPVVHMSWKPEGQDFPETLIFESGYRMELALAPLDASQLSGSLVLVMPDSFKSYLAGDFTAHSNHLRYRNGEVDLHFDHEDTLAYVAEQYLVTQFPEGALDEVEAEHVQLRRSEGTGQVMSRVALSSGAVEQRHVRLEKSDVGWAVTPGSMETRVVTPPREGSAELVTLAQQQEEEEKTATQPPISATFPELVAYTDKSVALELYSGRKLEGVLRRVSGDRLWLVMNVGSGNVERSVSAEELKSLTLADGQRVDVVDEEKAEPAPETAPAPEPEQQAPSSWSGRSSNASDDAESGKAVEYRPLVGKKVTITADDIPQRTGILQAVEQDHLTLSVPMGAGNMEYFYDLESVQTLEEAR
ncbi:MAG: hypothetical protein MI745_11690 [Pseudomonadales bacterium]|nr:hypothetical protein [Pseudomonadales bacterium]